MAWETSGHSAALPYIQIQEMAVFLLHFISPPKKTQVVSVFVFRVLDLIKEVLSLDDEIQKLAEELYQQKSVLIMGRGYHYATCLEGALVSKNIWSKTDLFTVDEPLICGGFQ